MKSEQTKLDKLLDDALRNYSEVEPRIGFDSRIIANLRAEPARPWWHMSGTYTSAAIMVVCVIFYGAWRLGGAMLKNPDADSPRLIANRLPAPEVVRTNPRIASPEPISKPALKQARSRGLEIDHQHTALASQMPAPMPLSKQERLLLAFARESPKEIEASAEWQAKMRQPVEQETLSDRGEQQ